jgi:hypothetical protein
MILRRGMWVRVLGADATGILVSFTRDEAEVHYVDAGGLTTLVQKDVPLDAVTQATYEDIPAARRPGEELAVQLGYAV